MASGSHGPYVETEINQDYCKNGDETVAVTAIGEEVPHLVCRHAVEQRQIECKIAEIHRREYSSEHEQHCEEAVESPHSRVIAQNFQDIGHSEERAGQYGENGHYHYTHHSPAAWQSPFPHKFAHMDQPRVNDSEAEYYPGRGDKSEKRCKETPQRQDPHLGAAQQQKKNKKQTD